jgi:nucleoid DNA-binding protein
VRALNLSKLIHEVWKDERTRKLGIRKGEVKILVEVMTDHMVKGLLAYGKLKIRGLFTLDLRKAKGRKIANPQTGEHMFSKDYYKVGVEPSKVLKDGMKNLK